MMRFRIFLLLSVALTLAGATAIIAGPRDDILAGYAANAGVASFDAQRGKAFFTANHTGGKTDTPSCTACHGPDPRNGGQTRAGKAIEPMAVSANPQRFADSAKVEKWFLRNCSTVLGRECTAQEKGEVITWLSSL
jgi:Domain of unknown function (DUF1924)